LGTVLTFVICNPSNWWTGTNLSAF
jgi:hypothetical protein